MKYFVVGVACLCGLIQIGTGCYLSLENGTGWVFPIVAGIATLGGTFLAAEEEV